ncbi:MAG: PadR family transcriptional regulator [Chloroflexi bacterium]|nr:PadR family transcriptional regulator [Chloroflexota bacterium]
MERELLLLGLLRRGDMHGYKLTEFINRDMAYCTDLKKPTAYHLLQRMAADGWIVVSDEQEGNRPPRKVYQLTAEGEAAFQRLLRDNLSEQPPTRFPGDIGLAFIEALAPAEALSLLTERRRTLQAELTAINRAQDAHGSGGLRLVIEHQQTHLRAELSWLDTVITRLRNDAAF